MSGLLRQLDLDVVPVYLNPVRHHSFGCRRPEDVPRGDVEGGPMPGAGHHRTVYLTF